MMKPSLIISAFLVIFSGKLEAQEVPKSLSIQAPIVNMRAGQDLKSAVIVKLKQLDYVDVIKRGNSATIDGITDFWYQVKSGDQTGYVFGHLTSLKKAGRRKVIKTFEECGMGDYFHIVFSGTDYGDGSNNLSKYEFCIEDNDGTRANPKYAGKKFELTINALVTQTYCGGGSMELCIRTVDSIVEIKLVPGQ